MIAIFKDTISALSLGNPSPPPPPCYCLRVIHSIIIRGSQSQFTIHFCMKYINYSLLSCLITVSPRLNNNSLAENANYRIIVHCSKKMYPYHTNINRNKILYPFYQKLIIKKQIKFKALRKLGNDNVNNNAVICILYLKTIIISSR